MKTENNFMNFIKTMIVLALNKTKNLDFGDTSSKSLDTGIGSFYNHRSKTFKKNKRKGL